MKARLRHKSKYKKSFQIVAISLVLIGLGMFLPRLFSVTTAAVMYPIHVTNKWLNESSSFIPVFFRDRQSLDEEIKQLKNDLIIAERSDLTQSRLIEENNRLRKLLGAAEEKRILAAVIARPDELPYDLLQIDQGSQDGVEVGAPVFMGHDMVIGLVVHVAPNYSFVEMISTTDFEASAFVSGPNVVAKLEGYGGGVARVKVPQGVPLQIGDLVYLPSIEPGVYGRISYIENLPTQSEQYGYISPDIPIASIYQVTVGKRSQISHSASEINQDILEQMRTELLIGGLNVVETSATSSASSTASSEQTSATTSAP